MSAFLNDWYMWLKALHLVSVIAWMAGLLYLPRLFVYHCEAEPGSQMSETFKTMERKLLRVIMNPAMIAAWSFAVLMLVADPSLFKQGWMHVKLTAAVIVTVLHHVYARWRKTFERDENARPAKFYRIWNEVPAVLMIVIVVMVIVKPF